MVEVHAIRWCMTIQKYDAAQADYTEADQTLFRYMGLLARAASQLEKNRDRFHFVGINHPGIGKAPEATEADGMDGRNFPDALKIAQALAKRTAARLQMETLWERLSPADRTGRTAPPVV